MIVRIIQDRESRMEIIRNRTRVVNTGANRKCIKSGFVYDNNVSSLPGVKRPLVLVKYRRHAHYPATSLFIRDTASFISDPSVKTGRTKRSPPDASEHYR